MGGIVRAIGSLFGGGGGTRVVYQPSVQQAPAQPAAPAADSAQKALTEESQVKKKRRGKAGLLVNPLSKDTDTGSGTGLNL